MIITEIQEEIIDEFELFDDWMQRYEYIIESGKSLPQIENEFKTDSNLIKGCQSKVWLHGQSEEGKLFFSADSDAILTRGIIALLLRVYSGQTPKDILDAEPFFIDQIGLKRASISYTGQRASLYGEANQAQRSGTTGEG